MPLATSPTELIAANRRLARRLWGESLNPPLMSRLRQLSEDFNFSISKGDLRLLNQNWYVTHVGLIGLAKRKKCTGIESEPVLRLCNCDSSFFSFKATVYKKNACRGFVGYGDANPSNVSPVVRGSELRIAETRAVNRALRKAYGIGICSVEEIGSFERQHTPERPVRKLPPESTNGTGRHAENGNASRVRDRLCQIIRQHKLDAELVKSYAIDFCGTQALREATREQVEGFIVHLAEWAATDRNALLCRLNSYLPKKESAA